MRKKRFLSMLLAVLMMFGFAVPLFGGNLHAHSHDDNCEEIYCNEPGIFEMFFDYLVEHFGLENLEELDNLILLGYIAPDTITELWDAFFQNFVGRRNTPMCCSFPTPARVILIPLPLRPEAHSQHGSAPRGTLYYCSGCFSPERAIRTGGWDVTRYLCPFVNWEHHLINLGLIR